MLPITIELLDDDLAQAKMSKRKLAQLLSEHGRAITEQGIGLWWQRAKVPSNRYAHLVEIFGPDSQTAKALGSPSTAWSRPMPVPRHAQAEAQATKTLSPEAQMLGEWLDKIPDGLIKFETFQAANALIIQALRRTQPTPEPAQPRTQETPAAKSPA